MVKMEKNVFAGCGISQNDDPYSAGKEAVERAIERAGKPPDFGFVFCSARKYAKNRSDIEKLVKGAHEAFMKANPNVKWIGCTTCGEIFDFKIYEGSCVAMAVASEFIHVGIGIGKNLVEEPVKAGENAARQALSDLKIDKYLDPYLQFLRMRNLSLVELARVSPYMLLCILPGTTKTHAADDNRVIQGLINVVGPAVPIIGGASGDDYAFEKTYQFASGKVYESDEGMVVMAIISNLKTGYGLKHGYHPTGKIGVVTKSEGKVVKEIDNKPAAQRYAELLGVSLEEIKKNFRYYMVSYPFGIRSLFGIKSLKEDFWIKTVLQILDDGSLVFLSPIREHTVLNLMSYKPEDVVDAAAEAINEASRNGELKGGFLLIFNCGGRKGLQILGKLDESKGLEKARGDYPCIGFYTYAEISTMPGESMGQHNQTIVCLRISDELLT